MENSRGRQNRIVTNTSTRGQVRMADISEKAPTVRQATAKGIVRMKPETFELIRQGKVPKGDVFAVARVAGIMAAKQTPSIIPLCHPLLIDDVSVEFRPRSSSVEISATVKCTGKTGVEMEALVAISAAALTIYDMCKPVDPAIRLDNIRLVRKSGGKSGTVVLE